MCHDKPYRQSTCKSTTVESPRQLHNSYPRNKLIAKVFYFAGINIFITEFQQSLGERASLLIPTDIENRLINGSSERYKDQYLRFRNLTCPDHQVQYLIDLINRYRKGYDQEGYIIK